MSNYVWNEHAYVPILLTRRGERSAVSDSRSEVLERITPLWLVAPVPWDAETEGPAKSVEEHIEGVEVDLVRCWGQRPAYVDTFYLDDAPLSTGQHPLVAIVERALSQGLPLTPVTGPDRVPVHHTAAAAAVALRPESGVCLRIPRDFALEWQSAPTSRSWDISSLVSQLGTTPEATDLVIDFGDDVDAPTAAAALVRAVTGSVPHLTRWRSLTFAGTSMLASMAGVPTMQVTPYARGEWETYIDLLGGAALGRPVRFGDYGVQHPDLTIDVDPRFMRVFSTFRYATVTGWLIARGKELRVDGYEHVHDLADLTVNHPDYAGPAFSEGDGWLDECAKEKNCVGKGCPSHGNAERWRRISTNHHLAHVTTELAGQYGIAAP